MNPLTSVELNLLVFRYLQESGFTHTAFNFGYESGIHKCPIDCNIVPMGALITIVQKGLHYIEMEANLDDNETEEEEDFSFFKPLDIISKDVNELRQIVNERKKNKQDGDNELGRDREGERKRQRERERHDRDKDKEKDRERDGKDKELEKQHESTTVKEMVVEQENKVEVKEEDNKAPSETEPMDFSTVPAVQSREIPMSDVTILKGHTSEVCACTWNPVGPFLASGSGDSTARIWSIADEQGQNEAQNVVVLKHVKGKSNEKSKDVTTLDWNGDGTFLATGSYDGQARIWNCNGELKSILSKHKGPIFSLKWNKKGDYILTGSCDKTAIVWDVKTEDWKQQFEFHSGPALDADWRNNVSFATSSTDTMIYVCKIGETRPIKTFAGHQHNYGFIYPNVLNSDYIGHFIHSCDISKCGEVNCVKWDPTGTLLASCSDDITAKIWSIKQDKYLHDLREHAKEIYTIRWSPTGPGSNNPNQQLLLASASFDSTVKVWDVELGKVLCSFEGHRDPVYSVAFSPNGEYLASGSLDRSLHIYSLKEGKIVKNYNGNGGIFEVCWNKEGNKIAGCSADHTICVLDFRM